MADADDFDSTFTLAALDAATGAAVAVVADVGLAGVDAVCANALPITKVVAMRLAISLFIVRPYSIFRA